MGLRAGLAGSMPANSSVSLPLAGGASLMVREEVITGGLVVPVLRHYKLDTHRASGFRDLAASRLWFRAPILINHHGCLGIAKRLLPRQNPRVWKCLLPLCILTACGGEKAEDLYRRLETAILSDDLRTFY